MSAATGIRVVDFDVADPKAPLRIGWRPRPVCRPDEVLIEVRAAGVNHADVAQRDGRYPLKPEANDILGLEVAGVVVAVGEAVSRMRPGDRVCALLEGGGYAELVAAPAVQCLRMPEGMGFEAAAVLPEAFATVWLNVFEKAKLQPGETLLVHGGASGVGIAAIQLASALGSKVLCTAGTRAKCAACMEEGALLAVNYREHDFEEMFRAAHGGKVDVVLDMVGGDYFDRNMQLLARDGRMACIAALGGSTVSLDLVQMMRKRIALFGSVLRPLSPARKGEILARMAATVWPLLEAGTIRPRIFQTFTFEQAELAHRLLASHGHIGKLVLLP